MRVKAKYNVKDSSGWHVAGEIFETGDDLGRAVEVLDAPKKPAPVKEPGKVKAPETENAPRAEEAKASEATAKAPEAKAPEADAAEEAPRATPKRSRKSR